MSDWVLREDRQGAAILTLNRPDKLNALNSEMFEALEEHLHNLSRETRQIGLIILRGTGGHFSSGYDMAEISQAVKAQAKPHYESEVIEYLANMPQPIIAAVQGECSTGALELALACDLIVTGESARFSEVYVRWGLTPIWSLSLRLPRRVGSARAREIIFTCGPTQAARQNISTSPISVSRMTSWRRSWRSSQLKSSATPGTRTRYANACSSKPTHCRCAKPMLMRSSSMRAWRPMLRTEWRHF
jgi:1,4-dihydroxy-2-naphthoyl-CoA synthase